MFSRWAVVCILTLGAAAPAFAQAVDQKAKPGAVVAPAKKSTVTAMVPAPDDRARQWLVLLDDKNYSQSWTDAGKTFQTRNKLDAWATTAGTQREPLGAVASRDLKSIDLGRTNVAVVRYDTVFAHKAAAVETVTLSFEDGGWAVTGYSVK